MHLTRTIPLSVIGRGFFRLNLFLLPVSLILLLYLGIMASGAPNGADPIDGFLAVAAFVYLFPAALVLAHVVGAKAFDGVLRLAPLEKAEVSLLGVLVSAALIVVAGNVFVDDLYQFNQGNYGLSVVALVLDVGGMLAVVLAGGGKAHLFR